MPAVPPEDVVSGSRLGLGWHAQRGACSGLWPPLSCRERSLPPPCPPALLPPGSHINPPHHHFPPAALSLTLWVSAPSAGSTATACAARCGASPPCCARQASLGCLCCIPQRPVPNLFLPSLSPTRNPLPLQDPVRNVVDKQGRVSAVTLLPPCRLVQPAHAQPAWPASAAPLAPAHVGHAVLATVATLPTTPWAQCVPRPGL